MSESTERTKLPRFLGSSTFPNFHGMGIPRGSKSWLQLQHKSDFPFLWKSSQNGGMFLCVLVTLPSPGWFWSTLSQPQEGSGRFFLSPCRCLSSSVPSCPCSPSLPCWKVPSGNCRRMVRKSSLRSKTLEL